MKIGKVLLYVLPPVVIIGVIFLINKKKTAAKAADAVKNGPLTEPKTPATAATPNTPAQASLFPLKKGSKNDKVGELQRILGVSIDNNFGPQTEASLKAFSGKITVDSQAELDALVAKKASQQNQSTALTRAQQLYTQFQKGGLNIFANVDTIGYGYVLDFSSAINYNGKNITLTKGGKFSNTDHKLIGYTKGGNLQMQDTTSNFAGTYIINPNSITLVP